MTEDVSALPASGESHCDLPVVLFACIHNLGRSVAAKVLTESLGAGRVIARSAG